MLKHAGVLAVFLALQVSLTIRHFPTTTNLEENIRENSANVSAGDLDAMYGDLDLVLAKGRSTPLVDEIILNDGKGRFTATDLGPTTGARTYSAVLAGRRDGDGDLDVMDQQTILRTEKSFI